MVTVICLPSLTAIINDAGRGLNCYHPILLCNRSRKPYRDATACIKSSSLQPRRQESLAPLLPSRLWHMYNPKPAGGAHGALMSRQCSSMRPARSSVSVGDVITRRRWRLLASSRQSTGVTSEIWFSGTRSVSIRGQVAQKILPNGR
jgi:hypothetical protein